MRIGNLGSSTLTVLLFATLIFAQIAPTESEKEKKNKETDERVVKLLDDAIAEGGSLRLPQNRANERDRRLNRADSRSMVKLYVVQGFLRDDTKPDDTVQGGMMIFNY